MPKTKSEEAEKERRAKISATLKVTRNDPEYKAKRKESDRIIRENLSDEEKLARKSRRKKPTLTEDQRKARGKKISLAHQNRSEEKEAERCEKMSKAAFERYSDPEWKEFWYSQFMKNPNDSKTRILTEEYSQKLSEARKRYYENISEEDYNNRCLAISQGRLSMSPEAKQLRKERQGASMREWFQSMTLEEHEEWYKKLLNGKIEATLENPDKLFMTINNTLVRFDSSWEIGLYNILIKLNIPFRYTNLDGLTYKLETTHWHPDFELYEHNIIIDTKAVFLAEEFKVSKLPLILKNKELSNKKIYLLCWNPNGKEDDFETLEQLLDKCELVS